MGMWASQVGSVSLEIFPTPFGLIGKQERGPISHGGAWSPALCEPWTWLFRQMQWDFSFQNKPKTDFFPQGDFSLLCYVVIIKCKQLCKHELVPLPTRPKYQLFTRMDNGSLDFCFQNQGLGLIQEEEIHYSHTKDKRVILEFPFAFSPGTRPAQSGRVLLLYFHANDMDALTARPSQAW